MDSIVALIAVGALLVATAVAYVQKRNLKEILGFDMGMLWSYRDTALGTVASIAALWAIVALLSPPNDFDRHLGVICIAIAIVCCGISPNRGMLVAVVFGFVAAQAWFAFTFFGNKFLWIAVPATLIVIIYLRLYGKRPIQRR